MKLFHLKYVMFVGLLVFCIAPSASYAASFIATQSGNWTLGSTWGNPGNNVVGSGVPGFGDTASTTQYTVTCPAGATCNIGTVHGSFPFAKDDLQIGDGTHAASLVIAGTAVFNLRGQAFLSGAGYTDNVNTAHLTIQSGGTLNLDENGGSVPSRFYIVSGTWPVISAGTSGDAAGTSVITSTNNGSANGILLDDSQANGYAGSTATFYGVAFSNLGSATTPFFDSEMYRANSSLTVDHSSINSSGPISTGVQAGITDGSVSLIVRSVVATNRLGTTDLYWNVGTGQTVTGTREISNSILRIGSNSGYGVEAVDFNMFDDVFDGYRTSPPSPIAAVDANGIFHDNLILNDTDCDESVTGLPFVTAAIINNIYSACTVSSGNSGHIFSQWNQNDGATQTMSNIVIDQQSSRVTGHGLIHGSPGGNNAYTQNFNNILVLENNITGEAGVGLLGWEAGSTPPPTYITHITQPGSDNVGTIYLSESSTVITPPLISSFKNNIYWDTSAREYPIDILGNPGSQPANLASPANISYNANYNAETATQWVNGFGPCSSGTPCTSNGTAYDLATTGSTPGSNDLTNVNPQLASTTANILTWATAHGQAATLAGAKAVFVAAGTAAIPTLLNNLFDYVRVSNSPENPLYWKAGSDGADIGAVDLSMNRHIPPPVVMP